MKENRSVPFLGFPPGLGGAIAVTVRRFGSGCQFARKWRETFPRDRLEEDILMDGENIEE